MKITLNSRTFFLNRVHMGQGAIIFLILMCCATSFIHSEEFELFAQDFGLKADAKSDDGPVIQKMLEEIAKKQLGEVTIKLVFPQNKTIYIETGKNRYVFDLKNLKNVTIDGRGSEFLLHQDLRFLNMFNCDSLQIQNIKVDYQLSPTTPGTIVAVDGKRKCLKVELDHLAMDELLAGPTDEDGEQDFFGMVLIDCTDEISRLRHYFVDDVKKVSKGVVEVFSNRSDFDFFKDHVVAGKTRIGIPVPGIAHRVGPGPLFMINHNRNVSFKNLDVWAAPWFSFKILRNEGMVHFDDVNVVPKPGSKKVLSSCRDAFHAKGNRAKLIFENCELSGLGDDAMNISNHCSRVRKVISATEVEISQFFPIQYMPFREGDTLVFMSNETNQVLGESVIRQMQVHHHDKTGKFENAFKGKAPKISITLEKEIPGLKKDFIVWAREASNPDTLVRNCIIRRSCRFQSNIKMDACTAEALIMFYGAKVEGPGPEVVELTNSTLKARLNWKKKPGLVVVIRDMEGRQQKLEHEMSSQNTWLKRVILSDNHFFGSVLLERAYHVELFRNKTESEGNKYSIIKVNCKQVKDAQK